MQKHLLKAAPISPLVNLFLVVFSLTLASVVAAQEADITTQTVIARSGLVYNRATNTFDTIIAIRNDSSDTLGSPAKLVITGISDPTVRVSNASGVTNHGSPYISLAVPNSGLVPGARIANILVKFSNPGRRPFSFSQSIFALIKASLSITIESPANGSSINVDTVAVSGSIVGPQYAGVTVNGVPAVITGDRYLAPGIPLRPGQNDLQVTATTINGKSVSASIQVAKFGSPSIGVFIRPLSGIAPFRAHFDIENRTGALLRSVSIDCDSDGVPEQTEKTEDLIAGCTYLQPGFYNATVSVTDASGNRVDQTVIVVAEDPGPIDQMLQSSWRDFATSLLEGDLDRGNQFLTDGAKAKYGPHFRNLGSRLQFIVQSFSPSVKVDLAGSVGEYAVKRVVDGVTRGFLMYFVKGVDGVWRIDAM